MSALALTARKDRRSHGIAMARCSMRAQPASAFDPPHFALTSVEGDFGLTPHGFSD
jgi:hypothetical protein